MKQNSADLNNDFAIAGALQFRDRGDGFPVAEIDTPHCRAAIAIHGAHLLDWQPAGSKPAIWLSGDATLAAGRSIRGGIPVCWPWFGAHPERADYPAHGFARTACWQLCAAELLADGDCNITLRLDTTADHPFWPHASRCELQITAGAQLHLTLITYNRGAEPFTITQALHSYFAVDDIRSIAVDGLDGGRYLDKLAGFAERRQQGAIRFASEVDRIYLDTTADSLIRDPAAGRVIRITKRGSASTVVWNPWQRRAEAIGDMGENGYLRMLCVESANAADDRITIAPGSSHALAVYYSVEAL